MEIFATIAALTKAQLNPDRPLDGMNQLPFLTGEQTGASHDMMNSRMFDKGACTVCTGDFKLVISGRRNEPREIRKLERRRADWNAQWLPPSFEGLRSEKKPVNSASTHESTAQD